MKELKTPFSNDPAALVALAFRELYPDKIYTAQLVISLATEDDVQVCSCTTYHDGQEPEILVNSQLPNKDIAEALAHELAHIAAGSESLNEHGDSWKEALEAIQEKYDELGEKLVGEGGENHEE